MEELIVAAIKADTQAQHHVRWQEKGHDDLADIVVRTNGNEYPIQIKSGQIKHDTLVLSGHRLGRFNGDLDEIGSYLNAPRANIIAIPHRKVDDDKGRKHIYRVCYLEMDVMTGLEVDEWEPRGKQYVQINGHGVEFSLRPSMSWQIWWKIPTHLIDMTEEFVIG